MRIYIESAGCTRRKLDVSKFHNYFRMNGHETIDTPSKADVILVTTCAFKKEEEDSSVAAIKRLQNHGAKMVVYGCLPEIAPSKYHDSFTLDYLSPKNINDIDNYFGAVTHRFADVSDANTVEAKIDHTPWPQAIGKFINNFEVSIPFMMRSAAYVKNKVLDGGREYYLLTSRGCLGNCSYCGVKFAVGSIKSKPIETVVHEMGVGLQAGHRQFVVLGDDVGAFGQDRGSNLPELLLALLMEFDRFTRGKAKGRQDFQLHLDELNPRWILQYKAQLLKLIGSGHIGSILCPIQSGNDRILDLMRRGHDSDSITDALMEMSIADPNLKLSTQIIVGFPSETEQEFEDSLQSLSRIRFDTITIFPYDEKENTEAAGIHPKVPETVVARRVARACRFFRKQGIKSVLKCK